MKLKNIAGELRKLEQSQRLRTPDDELLRKQLVERFGADFLDAASNDYLGLARSGASLSGVVLEDVSRETTDSSVPLGAGASRLIFGTSEQHLKAEEEVRVWLGFPAALLFSSGYAANVGALSALLSPEDAVFSDQLNHASLIDGIRLARVQPTVFPHLDLEELERGLQKAKDAPARWVVVEAYYSMDGDGPDLPRLRALCDQHDACLYVDEAHSVGTFGTSGWGLCADSGAIPDVLVAAFGKAVGSQGACVLGSKELRTWLWNRARSFVFSTAPSPTLVASLRSQIARTRAAHNARERLGLITNQVREALAQAKVPIQEGSFGPVVGILCGSEEGALGLAERLRSQGVLAQAIRPPTVPAGSSRVRLILRSSFTDSQVTRLIEIVARETSPEGA